MGRRSSLSLGLLSVEDATPRILLFGDRGQISHFLSGITYIRFHNSQWLRYDTVIQLSLRLGPAGNDAGARNAAFYRLLVFNFLFYPLALRCLFAGSHWANRCTLLLTRVPWSSRSCWSETEEPERRLWFVVTKVVSSSASTFVRVFVHVSHFKASVACSWSLASGSDRLGVVKSEMHASGQWKRPCSWRQAQRSSDLRQCTRTPLRGLVAPLCYPSPHLSLYILSDLIDNLHFNLPATVGVNVESIHWHTTKGEVIFSMVRSLGSISSRF